MILALSNGTRINADIFFIGLIELIRLIGLINPSLAGST
jgi:hypothetical protein